MRLRQRFGGEHDHATITALRHNLSILRELAMRYEVSTFRGRSPDRSGRGNQITMPEEAGRFLGPEMEPLVQEQLRVLLLDNKNRIVGQHLVYQGSVNTIQIRPAEVFREAVLEAAPRIILAHNHPSGDPEPSTEDIEITGVLMEAGRILGVDVLDHLIIGQGSYVSLRSRNLPQHSRWPTM